MSCECFLNYQRNILQKSNYQIEPDDCRLFLNKNFRGTCPAFLRSQRFGKKDKTFGIDFKTYSAIADRCAWMYQNRKHKLIFIALTFPKFKREVLEYELNEAFSRFIENLRETYHLRHYLAIREGDGLIKRYHYHVICDLPYVSFARLNDAWNSSISSFCYYSSCAFRTKKNDFYIHDVAGAVRYVSKYISKSIGERSLSRVFFTDHETAQAVVKMPFDDLSELPETTENFKSIQKKVLNDYVTRITFKTKVDQNRFFHSVIKVIFGHDWSVPGMRVVKLADTS